MESPASPDLEDEEEQDKAIVAAFLATDGRPDVVALEDAPTSVLPEAAGEPALKSPTSVSMACRNEPDDEDLLASLL